MKFGKWLKKQIEQSLPEWQEQFLRYKELKRCVKAVSGGCPPSSPAEEAGFVAALDAEIEKINAFFLEQEEEFIIGHLELQEDIKRTLARKAAGEPTAQHEAEVAAIRREIVNLHGEMVLLLNYSSINYIDVRQAHGRGAAAAGDHPRAALLQDGDGVADGAGLRGHALGGAARGAGGAGRGAPGQRGAGRRRAAHLPQHRGGAAHHAGRARRELHQRQALAAAAHPAGLRLAPVIPAAVADPHLPMTIGTILCSWPLSGK